MKIAPLSGFFMLASMLGFILSLLVVWDLSMKWGIAFAVLFAAMFTASMLSMTYANEESELEIDFKKKKKK